MHHRGSKLNFWVAFLLSLSLSSTFFYFSAVYVRAINVSVTSQVFVADDGADCNNGVVEPGEACENNFACSAGFTCNLQTCACEEVIGGGDPPDPICTPTGCSGLVWTGVCLNGFEQGQGINNCNNICFNTRPCGCGNGLPDSGEECDDGNVSTADQCDTLGTTPQTHGACTATFCGDGAVQNYQLQVSIAAVSPNRPSKRPLSLQRILINAYRGTPFIYKDTRAERHLLFLEILAFINNSPVAPSSPTPTSQSQSQVVVTPAPAQVQAPSTPTIPSQTFSQPQPVSSPSQQQNLTAPPSGPGFEECDDGNTAGGDGCSSVCQIEIGCGDGSLDPGEQCDDSNSVTGDGCDANCTVTACGNGIVSTATGEECDDSNTISGDGCSAACIFEACGNGVIEFGEVCDDGNSSSADACDTNGINPGGSGRCTLTFCGDATVQPTNGQGNLEQCDDGNTVSGDGCSSICLNESVCNNGTVEAGEECDPPGLGCSSSCQFELAILTFGVSGITQDTATISWTTNLTSTSVLEWEEDGGGVTGSVTLSTPTASYVYVIGNLTAGTRYHYTITATRVGPPADQDVRTGTFVTIFINQCGDGICTGDETFQSCPADCVDICTPNWSVTEWGACVDGIQTREYTDLNNCPYPLDPPPDQKCCAVGCTTVCGICQKLNVATQSCDPIFPCCGDRICEGSENVSSCTVDCGIPPTVTIALTRCLDGLDNDDDGLVDYPADPGCSSPSDTSELDVIEVLTIIFDNPIAEQVNRFAAPLAIIAMAISTFASFSFLNLLLYLRYLFTQPFGALFRRRRHKWGVVYNSLSKQPVDLAIVRLYKKDTDQLIQSRVTDKQGRYNFLVEPGEYYLTVTKPQHTFPSQYLKDKKQDARYLDLYHGEVIRVTDKQVTITVNIPVDAEAAQKTPRRLILGYYGRKVQHAVAFLSVPFALLSFAITPTVFTGVLVLFHTFLFLMFHRLGYQKPPKNWGIVYDEKTKKPLARAITRIYDKHYNKLLETRITDGKGRYSFLVSNNIYYLTAEKGGYNSFKTADIDLIDEKVDEIVDEDIGLAKLRRGEQPVQQSVVSGVSVQAPPLGKVGLPAAIQSKLPTVGTSADEPTITELQRQVNELGVSRTSLEELTKTKEKIKNIKGDIDTQQAELEKLEDTVEAAEEDVLKKIDTLSDATVPPAKSIADELTELKQKKQVAPSSADAVLEQPTQPKQTKEETSDTAPAPPQKNIFG